MCFHSPVNYVAAHRTQHRTHGERDHSVCHGERGRPSSPDLCWVVARPSKSSNEQSLPSSVCSTRVSRDFSLSTTAPTLSSKTGAQGWLFSAAAAGWSTDVTWIGEGLPLDVCIFFILIFSLSVVFPSCSGALVGDCRLSSWCSVGSTPVFLHILHLAARSQCFLRQRPCETATPPDGKSRTEDGRLPRHPGQKPRSTPSAPQRSLPPYTSSTLRGWRIFAPPMRHTLDNERTCSFSIVCAHRTPRLPRSRRTKSCETHHLHCVTRWNRSQTKDKWVYHQGKIEPIPEKNRKGWKENTSFLMAHCRDSSPEAQDASTRTVEQDDLSRRKSASLADHAALKGFRPRRRASMPTETMALTQF